MEAVLPQQSWPLLSALIFFPLLGAMFILFLRGDDVAQTGSARWIALLTSLVVLALSFLLWRNFDRTTSDFQFVEEAVWSSTLQLSYRVGVDGISAPFVLLCALLIPICILATWNASLQRGKEYMIAFLTLETFIIGMFCALDLVLFYVFFEGVLIPMFLIIGIWGGPRRVYAAFKFFLYTLGGSLLMLLGVIVLYLHGGSDISSLVLGTSLPYYTQFWLWLAFFASFAVKVPMWPFHTWLPDAHVEAPTAGSVILAGVLLKMGAYGFLRFSMQMLPQASATFAPLIFVLSVVAIVYTSLVALAQTDMKKLIAYSSIAHMGFVTFGIFSANQQGVTGAIYQMLSHGLVSAALFLCVGVVYDRTHTRQIADYGGLARKMPRYSVFLMIFLLASVGLPGTSGFVGEFLVIVGGWQVDPVWSFLIASSMVLGAAYMLRLYRRAIFGPIKHKVLHTMIDLDKRETIMLVPLVFLVLFAGVYPLPFLEAMEVSVTDLLSNYHAANARPEVGLPTEAFLP